MGRSPCCSDEANLKKGPWTPEEDKKLTQYIEQHGQGSWRRLPKLAGLNRCGKSCRLRWTNYLRPDIRRGKFSDDEEQLIVQLHSNLGNKWSAIAGRLPGRTDNEIKNYWNTHLRKKLLSVGIDPVTHRPRTDLSLLASIPNLLLAAHLGHALQPLPDAGQLLRLRLLHGLMQLLCSTGCSPAANLNNSQQMNMQGDGVALSLPREETSCMNSGDNPIPIPSLVSSSPAKSSAEQKPPPPFTSSVVSPSFEPWCELNLDDLDCGLSWKDILNKLS